MILLIQVQYTVMIEEVDLLQSSGTIKVKYCVCKFCSYMPMARVTITRRALPVTECSRTELRFALSPFCSANGTLPAFTLLCLFLRFVSFSPRFCLASIFRSSRQT